jgi:hypothetical protein
MPQKSKPVKIAIRVKSGCVETVIATDKTVDVTVLDCDGDDRDVNEARWEKLCAHRRYRAVH